ncbi:MAG TPA: N-acetylneuraminate synthase family protein [Hanamia sp.]
MNYTKPIVIAEIGCNQMGQFEIAKELIKLSQNCGADVAKFQKRNNKEKLIPEQYNGPHPNAWKSFGSTYGTHSKFLEYSTGQHSELKK